MLTGTFFKIKDHPFIFSLHLLFPNMVTEAAVYPSMHYLKAETHRFKGPHCSK